MPLETRPALEPARNDVTPLSGDRFVSDVSPPSSLCRPISPAARVRHFSSARGREEGVGPRRRHDERIHDDRGEVAGEAVHGHGPGGSSPVVARRVVHVQISRDS
eukprot:30937-Pelagococcus_subviridis.AAC.39